MALRRRRVNLLRGRIEIKEAAVEVNSKLVFGEPKTHQHRNIAMPIFLKTMLVEHLRTYVALDRDAFVFTSRSDNLLRSPNWRRECGLPPSRPQGSRSRFGSMI